MIRRLVWACVCLVLWPVYYAWLFVRWLFIRPWRVGKDDERLWRAFRSPPYVDRVRG